MNEFKFDWNNKTHWNECLQIVQLFIEWIIRETKKCM